jgi:dTDP-4-amino-4,6-dideoxygalactose transaminase
MMNITEPFFTDDELREIEAVLQSKWVTQGPRTSLFEEQFAARHQTVYALATTSCTAALHLSTLALELGPGDEVIVPAFTWVTSAHAAEYVGARAVFADIDLSTFNIDPVKVEAAITSATRAIVVVHLFGKSAPMDELKRIAHNYNLLIIEDAACAVGTTYNGVPVGGLGDIGCFSFHPRKVITTGEGGMVTTNRRDLSDRVKSLRNHGATGPPSGMDTSLPYVMSTFNMLGYNLRLSDIQAAIGIAQMRKLDQLLSERRSLALNYSKLLSQVEEIVVPNDDPGHTYQSYVIRLRKNDKWTRNRIMDRFASQGIQTRPGTHAVCRLGYYVNKYGLNHQHYENALIAEDNSITLPIFPGMSIMDQEIVVGSLKASLHS